MPETINVEHAGTSYTVLYLYKYLFKGNKKVKATFEKVDYSNKKDENFMYMRAKYICSMKLMSKSMESMSNEPSNKTIWFKITVKLPFHVHRL